MLQRGSPRKKKKKNEAIQESPDMSIVPAGSTSGPTPMYFPPSQGCSNNLSSGKTSKSACGSSQPEVLSIQFPSSDTTLPPPATSKPTKEEKGTSKTKCKEGKGHRDVKEGERIGDT
ncbi:uncharacterized protein [Miscanthus floridulus]|uniref:uncharacterized protein n=1 Tax=Miscanthus floridulus TaxID=154761 RepID=UPI00345B46D2